MTDTLTPTLTQDEASPTRRSPLAGPPVPPGQSRRAWRLPSVPQASPRRWLALTVGSLLLAFVGCLAYLTAASPGREATLDGLTAFVKADHVASATFLDHDARIVGTTHRGDRFWVAYPASDAATAALLQQLTASGAEVSVDGQPSKGVVRIIATGFLPLMILAALFGLFLTGGAGGGSDQVRRFGTLARRDGGRATPPAVRFDDVAGADEAVAELREVVEYLNDPGRYAALGANPPKGVLRFGPPGTGKTLIARATAGEAGVPFFSVAGAEFVESLVGVGAARIRDLFAGVRAAAPAIVFIDELDAAGRRRGGADSGSSEEREQTLNQLLVELDGFAASSGVVVMAATNRPDILDPALLRPGRFDRHVTVAPPDRAGRARILAVHTKDKPLAPEVDLDLVAARTSGFTGADLANVVNEAALLAIREGRSLIGMKELVEAIERLVGGPQRRGRILTEPVRRRIATHEAGHAIVSSALGEEVHRVSVVTRGNGLGATSLSSDRDAVLLTADELFQQVVIALSGRCAEELVLGAPSTWSEDDLERATGHARDMVTRYGMADGIGRMHLARPARDTFLGADTLLVDMSDQLRNRVEVETLHLLERAFQRATDILRRHVELLDVVIAELLVEEVLEGQALEQHLVRVDRPQ